MQARFDVTASDEPGHVRVTVAGECDLAVSDRLITVLLAAVDESRLVVVDLAGLDFLDSSGVHGLVLAHRAARERVIAARVGDEQVRIAAQRGAFARSRQALHLVGSQEAAAAAEVIEQRDAAAFAQ